MPKLYLSVFYHQFCFCGFSFRNSSRPDRKNGTNKTKRPPLRNFRRIETKQFDTHFVCVCFALEFDFFFSPFFGLEAIFANIYFYRLLVLHLGVCIWVQRRNTKWNIHIKHSQNDYKSSFFRLRVLRNQNYTVYRIVRLLLLSICTNRTQKWNKTNQPRINHHKEPSIPIPTKIHVKNGHIFFSFVVTQNNATVKLLTLCCFYCPIVSNSPCWRSRIMPCIYAAVYVVVLATGTHYNVPAGAVVHDRGAWLLVDHVLRARRATWAHAADD